MAAESHFRAMGTNAHLVVEGGPPTLLSSARSRLAELEARWSRFLPTSELRRLNALAGRPVVVSPDTFDVIELAVRGWEDTSGRFDPTVLSALVRAGYDRSFDLLELDDTTPPAAALATPGCTGIVLSRRTRSVTLPVCVGLDLGGIGKGRAADVVANELIAMGAAGACVNLGGDVRVTGTSPTADGWVVSVEHPADESREIARLALTDGAVVTTTRLKRRWRRGGASAHHIIDPLTGAPARSGLAAVTVVAGDAATAEVLAKAAFVAGLRDAPDLLTEAGVSGLLVDDDDDDGNVHNIAGIQEFAV